jgi:hypothetical protein
MNCIEPYSNGDVLFKHLQDVLGIPDGVRSLTISINDGVVTGWKCKAPEDRSITMEWKLIRISPYGDIKQVKAEVGNCLNTSEKN